MRIIWAVLGVVLARGVLLHAQELHRESEWTNFTTSSGSVTVQHGAYRFIQKFDPQSLTGQIYIQRQGQKELRQIFANRRAVEFLLGRRGELALVNYIQSTKDLEVYVADVSRGKNWRIDQQALRMFFKNSGADPSLMVVARGEALSPDDQQALLSMNLIYISVSTAEEAEQKGKTFKKWWYGVSTSTGQVLHEYQTPSVPRPWLSEYRKSGSEIPTP